MGQVQAPHGLADAVPVGDNVEQAVVADVAPDRLCSDVEGAVKVGEGDGVEGAEVGVVEPGGAGQGFWGAGAGVVRGDAD